MIIMKTCPCSSFVARPMRFVIMYQGFILFVLGIYFEYYHFGHYYIFWTLSSGSLLSCIYGLHIDVGRTLLNFYL